MQLKHWFYTLQLPSPVPLSPKRERGEAPSTGAELVPTATRKLAAKQLAQVLPAPLNRGPTPATRPLPRRRPPLPPDLAEDSPRGHAQAGTRHARARTRPRLCPRSPHKLLLRGQRQLPRRGEAPRPCPCALPPAPPLPASAPRPRAGAESSHPAPRPVPRPARVRLLVRNAPLNCACARSLLHAHSPRARRAHAPPPPTSPRW